MAAFRAAIFVVVDIYFTIEVIITNILFVLISGAFFNQIYSIFHNFITFSGSLAAPVSVFHLQQVVLIMSSLQLILYNILPQKSILLREFYFLTYYPNCLFYEYAHNHGLLGMLQVDIALVYSLFVQRRFVITLPDLLR